MKGNKILFMAAVLLLSNILMGCGNFGKPAEKTEIYVLAAASLTDALQAAAVNYEQAYPDDKLIFSFSSSGALQAQIQEGAPADVFISAAQYQMDSLVSLGLINEASRIDLLENRLVLITQAINKHKVHNFAELGDLSTVKIALGEPKSVPAGQYSKEVFTKLGIWEKVQPKAVYGSDVRQVLSWVEAGEVEYGIVYATDAAVSDGVEIVATADRELHRAIIYPAALLKSSCQTARGQNFLNYLQSADTQKIFTAYGFTVKQ